MDPETIAKTIEKIIEADPRYSREAYEFVGDAVGRTIAKVVEGGEKRHITGGELLEGIRLFALEEFGPMAEAVFNHWGIHDTLDIGNVVFNMVDNSLLSSSENDSIDDFKGVFDLSEAFSAPFLVDERPDIEIKAVDI